MTSTTGPIQALSLRRRRSPPAVCPGTPECPPSLSAREGGALTCRGSRRGVLGAEDCHARQADEQHAHARRVGLRSGSGADPCTAPGRPSYAPTPRSNPKRRRTKSPRARRAGRSVGCDVSRAMGCGIPVDLAEEGTELTDVGAVAKDLLGSVAETEARLGL
jgi:hypothetical protein